MSGLHGIQPAASYQRGGAVFFGWVYDMCKQIAYLPDTCRRPFGSLTTEPNQAYQGVVTLQKAMVMNGFQLPVRALRPHHRYLLLAEVDRRGL